MGTANQNLENSQSFGRRIGVFGGTFDPPHIGHLILAAEAKYQLSLDRMLFVLTPNPPHKTGRYISPLALRLEMLQAAIGDNLTFELSRVDMDRLGPHYTLDTINILRLEYPNDEIIYLIGGDSLHDLPNWHRALEFIEACDEIGVMRRPGDDVDLGHLEAALPGVKRKLRFVSAPLLEIASHQVRRRIAERRPYQYYLRPAVCDVIEKRGIYKAS